MTKAVLFVLFLFDFSLSTSSSFAVDASKLRTTNFPHRWEECVGSGKNKQEKEKKIFFFSFRQIVLFELVIVKKVVFDCHLRSFTGHAALSNRADWRIALKQVHDELGLKRVRFHGIFDDDMSVVLSSMFVFISLLFYYFYYFYY